MLATRKTKVVGEDGGSESMGLSEAAKRQVYRDARELTRLTRETTATKNYYENKLIQEYTEEDFDQQRVEDLVQEYTNARIKDLMLKPKFAKAVQSAHGHLYLKVLRERVLEELNFGDGALDDELDWSKTKAADAHDSSDGKSYDIAALYNLNDLSNENAIGFNKLEERAANIEENNDIAHESVFDKMLADFFLHKRGDIKKGNKLITELEQILGAAKTSKDDGSLSGEQGDHTLAYQYAVDAVTKEDHPRLQQYKFTELMHIDMALNRHLHDNKSALSVALKKIPDERVMIPEYYDGFDVRMPADVYVMRKFDSILEEVFEGRLKVEKHLSRAELLAYDHVLARYLKKEILMQKLRREVYLDYNALGQANQVLDQTADAQNSHEMQWLKTGNKQQQFSRAIEDEDAYYKLLAYTGNLEKQRRKDHKATTLNPVLAQGGDTFEQFYQQQLTDDARRPPREIDEQALMPKAHKRRTASLSGATDDTFKTRAQRGEQLFTDYDRYREGQLEQKERQELFGIFEQMLQASHEAPATDKDDKLAAAQQHIRDYFSKAENTYFFDKGR